MEKNVSIPHEVMALLEVGRTTLIVLLISIGALKFVFKIDMPTEIFVILAASFIIVMVATIFGRRFFSIQATENIIFLFLSILSLLMTFTIFFIGEIQWLTGIFYAFLVMTGGLILPKRKASTVTMISSFGYIFLIFSGWLELSPYKVSRGEMYSNPTLNFVIVIVMVCMLYLITYLTNTFSIVAKEMYRGLEQTKTLEGRLRELERLNTERSKELEEARDDLRFTQDRVRELKKELDAVYSKLKEGDA